MRADGMFIAVQVDDAVAADAELAAKLTEVCPVDIYGQQADGTLRIPTEAVLLTTAEGRAAPET